MSNVLSSKEKIFHYPAGESPSGLLAKLSTERALNKELEARIEALEKHVAELNDKLDKVQTEVMNLRLKNKELVNKYGKSDSDS